MAFAQQVLRKEGRTERMRGPNLAVFVPHSEGVQIGTALRLADIFGLVIASNKRLGNDLIKNPKWWSEAHAFWSGSMTAYDKPNEKLRTNIEYVERGTNIRYVFPVPAEYRGEKNVVLVAEHPNFRLEKDRKNRIVLATEVGLVSQFPTTSGGWHLGDAIYDIPTGKIVPQDPGYATSRILGACPIVSEDRPTVRAASRRNLSARRLWRTDHRVGLVARGYGGYWSLHGDGVCLGSVPWYDFFGVIVEATKTGAPKPQIIERDGDGGLLITGTPEQITAAVRLLERLK